MLIAKATEGQPENMVRQKIEDFRYFVIAF